MKIDLNSLKSKPHPFRAIFRKHKVTNSMVANYLETHPVYACSVLNGTAPMSEPFRRKLQILIDQLESAEVN